MRLTGSREELEKILANHCQRRLMGRLECLLVVFMVCVLVKVVTTVIKHTARSKLGRKALLGFCFSVTVDH